MEKFLSNLELVASLTFIICLIYQWRLRKRYDEFQDMLSQEWRKTLIIAGGIVLFCMPWALIVQKYYGSFSWRDSTDFVGRMTILILGIYTIIDTHKKHKVLKSKRHKALEVAKKHKKA